MDCVVAYHFFHLAVTHGVYHYWYFGLTVTFVLLPSLTMTGFSLRWYLQDAENAELPEVPTWRWILRILILLLQVCIALLQTSFFCSVIMSICLHCPTKYILSNLVHFVQFSIFCPYCPILCLLSNFVHIVQFCPYFSFLSNFVLIFHFCPI